MEPIVYIDRVSGKEEVEKVYGAKALAFLYGNDLLSKLLGTPALHLLSRFPFFSAFYGWWQARGWTQAKIAPFIQNFDVDANEFQKSVDSFTSFNDFFIRKLKPKVRPIDKDENVAVIPADARYWFYQDIAETDGFIVKGEKFALATLIEDLQLAQQYARGSMAIARLCPSDYHRFHFPCSGVPSESRLINGYLYSVNPIAIRKDLEIFTKNKRTICTLRSPVFGNVLYIEIGATSVGSIHQTYTPNQPIIKGDEKGYFSFGASSIILLFESGRIKFDPDLLEASARGKEIRCLFGQSMGSTFC